MAVSKANLIAWWQLEEATGATRLDETVNNLDLTDFNTVEQVAGHLLNAGQFTKTNSEYLRIADTNLLSIETGESFTLSSWPRPEDLLDSMDYCSKWDGATNFEYIAQYNFTSNKYSWVVRDTASNNRTVDATNFGNPTAKVFVHILTEYEAGVGIRIRVNNGTPNSLSFATTVNTTGANFLLGARAHPTIGAVWNGRIDQTIIWKRILTADEITFLFNNGLGRQNPFVDVDVTPVNIGVNQNVSLENTNIDPDSHF